MTLDQPAGQRAQQRNDVAYTLNMQTPHVFLDTSIFIAQNYNYSSTPFKQIVSLAQDERLFVYVTSIVVREVEVHIKEDVEKAWEAFEGIKQKTDLRILKNIKEAPLHGIFDGFDVAPAIEILKNQFREFLQKAKVNVLEIADVSAEKIFEQYFSRTPPFGDKKKNEFPDAFSLAAIEEWCRKTSVKMHVVSTDPDCQEACALNVSFKSVQSLPEFLDLLSRGEELAQLVNKLFEEHQDVVLQSIKDNVDPLNLIYEPYGQFQYAILDAARIVKHYLIEVEEGKAVFDVVTEVSYSANVLYPNNLLMTVMGIPGGGQEFEYGSSNVHAEVRIAFDEKLDQISVESIDVKHDNIYVFPEDDPEDFVRRFIKAHKALAEHVTLIVAALGGTTWVNRSTPESVIKRFDEIKESLPQKVILDLETLNMLNPLTGGLNHYGATAIKNRLKASRSLYPTAVQRAIENATRFNEPTLRRMLEDNKLFNRPSVQRIIEDATLLNRSAVQRVMEEVTLRNRLNVQNAIEKASRVGLSVFQRATGSYQSIYRNPLSGHITSPLPLLSINPKRSDESLLSLAENQPRVEVLRNADVYGTEEDENQDEPEEALDHTKPFEFDYFPITVKLNHNVDRPKPKVTQHRLQAPTLEEWMQWGLALKRSVRYLSREEVKAEFGEDDDMDDESEVWTLSNEWEASERLYDQVILEVAGIKFDKDDTFPADKFRPLPPALLQELWFETKTTVITRLYRCYCELEQHATSNSKERSIRQYIDFDSETFSVRHVLKNPDQDEISEFSTNIVKGSFSTDEEGREIINLHLNLATAVTFYDKLLVRIENGVVNGSAYQDTERENFLKAINPVYKLRVLEPLFDVNAWYFKIDETTIP